MQFHSCIKKNKYPIFKKNFSQKLKLESPIFFFSFSGTEPTSSVHFLTFFFFEEEVVTGLLFRRREKARVKRVGGWRGRSRLVGLRWWPGKSRRYCEGDKRWTALEVEVQMLVDKVNAIIINLQLLSGLSWNFNSIHLFWFCGTCTFTRKFFKKSIQNK